MTPHPSLRALAKQSRFFTLATAGQELPIFSGNCCYGTPCVATDVGDSRIILETNGLYRNPIVLRGHLLRSAVLMYTEIHAAPPN
ncbi:MAG: hypothetical protein WCG04_03980 [Alphaproteobacteria bacterium]